MHCKRTFPPGDALRGTSPIVDPSAASTCHPSSADSSSSLGRFPKNTHKADSSSLSNMCYSTSDLLVTHTLTQSNRPSRLPFAVWSATCWTNPNPNPKECLWIMKSNLPKYQMVYWHHFN